MPRFIALDIDPAGGTVVAAAVGKGGVVVIDQALAWEADGPPLSVETAAAVGAKLRETLRAAGVKPAPLLLVLGRDRVIFKDVKYPPAAASDEPALVRFQALRDLADAADDVVMDYRPVGATPDGERRAQVVFVRKDVAAAARALAAGAGLRLAGVTPRPFAVAEAAARARGAADFAAAVVTPGAHGGEFTVVRGPDVLLSRTLPANAFGSPAALGAELRRNLAVYAGQPGAVPVAGIFISEAADAADAWAARLDALAVPVESFDPLAGFGAKADLVPSARRGRFAGAVGVVLSRANHPVLPINLAAPRQPKDAPGPARTRVLVGVLAAVLVVAGGGLFGFTRLRAADDRLAALRADARSLDDDTQRLSMDAKRLEAIDQFETRQVVWLDELYDWADRVPDVGKATVTEFAGTGGLAAPKPKPNEKPAAGPVGVVVVTGRAADPAQVQQVVDAFAAPADRKHLFGGVNRKVVGGGGSGVDAGKSAFTLAAQLSYRSPAEYVRRLAVAPPSRPIDDATALDGGSDR